ncbi:glucose-1-phosphate adenylyltransferase subunit GlgD [Inconstantimicrobium porci]|uniref:glucose-1-phosphate adenylyltransferase subunit GlgD n=1 Tax=Inconstantimicrobium porci TaxID=2652291 RepID=UPI0024098D2E|nr:glucose-1-phosphate adenylyltransferase subunit GlgD [Inconstantimicrobium porci]MDD6771442.1 glucose-1-phosphate adenylyltransferase subunit GlgD [Inconstantimicrobium porci]
MKNYVGIINLDEKEDQIRELTITRPLASVPLGGRYRIIDFILSNMTNAGIDNIGIFAKSASRSLMDHLSNGRPWDLHRKKDGLRFFNFGQTAPVDDDVHVFADNLDFFKYCKQEYILLAPSYMICNIDFVKAEEYHEQSGADVTIIYKKVNNANDHFYGCDLLNIEDERVVSVGKNIGNNKEATIGMEMFLMKKDLFVGLIYECIKTGKWSKIKQCIYANLSNYKVRAFEFDGYLSCVNSLASYYKANMDLLNTRINNELFFENGPIYTKTKDEAPTKYTEDSNVVNSIVANGCYIEGTVENCIISRRVKVNKGAVLKNCIILQNTVIGPDAKLTHVITDKCSYISKGENLMGSKNYPIVIEKQRIF